MAKVTVRFFAGFREAVGQSELSWKITPESTAGQLLLEILAEFPGLSANTSALIMVNKNYAKRETGLKDGDEVAFFPPVGGG